MPDLWQVSMYGVPLYRPSGDHHGPVAAKSPFVSTDAKIVVGAVAPASPDPIPIVLLPGSPTLDPLHPAYEPAATGSRGQEWPGEYGCGYSKRSATVAAPQPVHKGGSNKARQIAEEDQFAVVDVRASGRAGACRGDG